jgi:hypothetical protein
MTNLLNANAAASVPVSEGHVCMSGGSLRLGPASDHHENEAAHFATGQGVPTRAVTPAGQVQRQHHFANPRRR